MRLLVLGPHGQLGHALLPAARARGLEAVGLGRDVLDLSRPDDLPAVLAAHDFDVLVNAAACHGTDRIETEAEAAAIAFAVNGRAPGWLAAACRERGARLVHVSSDYVFDGEAARAYREEDAPGPINVYGASKLMGESLARRAHPAGTLVVRTASVYGVPASGHGSGSFVDTVLRVAREGKPLRVVDDVVMSPTRAGDLAAAILDLLEANAPAGTWHLVNAGAASWHDFARAVVEEAGIAAEVEAVPASSYGMAAARPRHSVLDTTKARALTTLRPWREALAEHLAEPGDRTERRERTGA